LSNNPIPFEHQKNRYFSGNPFNPLTSLRGRGLLIFLEGIKEVRLGGNGDIMYVIWIEGCILKGG